MIWTFALCVFVSPVHAGQVQDHVAMRVFIGEAADQGFKGMVCVKEL